MIENPQIHTTPAKRSTEGQARSGGETGRPVYPLRRAAEHSGNADCGQKAVLEIYSCPHRGPHGPLGQKMDKYMQMGKEEQRKGRCTWVLGSRKAA